MLSGNITLEDINIQFQQSQDKELVIDVTLTREWGSDDGKTTVEHLSVPQDKFFKALSIAVHNDGMPEYEKDYEDAESIMGLIRWIP